MSCECYARLGLVKIMQEIIREVRERLHKVLSKTHACCRTMFVSLQNFNLAFMTTFLRIYLEGGSELAQ